MLAVEVFHVILQIARLLVEQRLAANGANLVLVWSIGGRSELALSPVNVPLDFAVEKVGAKAAPPLDLTAVPFVQVPLVLLPRLELFQVRTKPALGIVVLALLIHVVGQVAAAIGSLHVFAARFAQVALVMSLHVRLHGTEIPAGNFVVTQSAMQRVSTVLSLPVLLQFSLCFEGQFLAQETEPGLVSFLSWRFVSADMLSFF